MEAQRILLETALSDAREEALAPNGLADAAVKSGNAEFLVTAGRHVSSAVEPLVTLATHPNKRVDLRVAAIEALGENPAGPTAETALRSLLDAKPEVAHAARQALVQLELIAPVPVGALTVAVETGGHLSEAEDLEGGLSSAAAAESE